MSPKLAQEVAASLVNNGGKIDNNRSPHWPQARSKHLASNPACAACGSTRNVEVHHKEPFHLHPEKELDPDNFITLCESDKNGVNCHLLFGHLGSYQSYNPEVVADAATWRSKMAGRPSND